MSFVKCSVGVVDTRYYFEVIIYFIFIETEKCTICVFTGVYNKKSTEFILFVNTYLGSFCQACILLANKEINIQLKNMMNVLSGSVVE